jgi:hypothetical protein
MENNKAYSGYEKLKDDSNSKKEIYQENENLKLINKEKSLNQYASDKLKKTSSEDEYFNSEKSDSIKNDSYLQYDAKETIVKLKSKGNDTTQTSSQIKNKVDIFFI